MCLMGFFFVFSTSTETVGNESVLKRAHAYKHVCPNGNDNGVRSCDAAGHARGPCAGARATRTFFENGDRRASGVSSQNSRYTTNPLNVRTKRCEKKKKTKR